MSSFLLLFFSLNECYFAGKGTALMLGSNERLRNIDGRRVSQVPNELSCSQTSIGSVGSDIQQHLQSMFYLLRPEETLKMVSFVLILSAIFLVDISEFKMKLTRP